MQPLKLLIYDLDVRNPQHKERFGALNREWLERYFYVEPHDEADFADPQGRIIDKGGIMLMAETDEGIVGTGSLFALEAGVYEVAKMAVTHAAQGQGIGEKVLLTLMERARLKQAHKLFIVSHTSLERAIRLYRRHGFKDSPENRHARYARGNITLERAL